MKKSVLMLSLAASLAGMSPVAHADLNSLMQRVNAQAQVNINSYNQTLSVQFGVSTPRVEAIVRASNQPADAFMILHLSQMSRVPPEQVLQTYQRNRSKGWGVMAKELGIKPGSPEFHALKSGNLRFAGDAGGSAAEPGPGGGHGHGGGHGRGHGNKD